MPSFVSYPDLGHHYDEESEYFLHHEELYHGTPETQTDESYNHPEGKKDASRLKSQINAEWSTLRCPQISNILPVRGNVFKSVSFFLTFRI